MSEHDPDLDGDVEDEPIQVETRVPAAGHITVRFSPEEMREIREETRRSGKQFTTLIREATLAAVRARRVSR